LVWDLKIRHYIGPTVFGRVKQKGKGKTFYDTADPNPNTNAIPDLIEKVFKTEKVDILSLNENEAITYANLLDKEFKESHAHLGFAELAMKAARVLVKRLPARIDLHTTSFPLLSRAKGR